VNTKRTFRKQTPDAHAFFLSQLSQLQYHSDYSPDMQTEFNYFYSYLQSLLDSFYSQLTITKRTNLHHSCAQGSSEAEEQLMRAGRTDEASALASRIGRVIQ